MEREFSIVLFRVGDDGWGFSYFRGLCKYYNGDANNCRANKQQKKYFEKVFSPQDIQILSNHSIIDLLWVYIPVNYKKKN